MGTSWQTGHFHFPLKRERGVSTAAMLSDEERVNASGEAELTEVLNVKFLNESKLLDQLVNLSRPCCRLGFAG